MNNLSFITLTNKGYLNYTFNCLKSLENIGVEGLKVYAIGKKANRSLTRRNYNSELIDDESNTKFQKFRTGNWADIIYYKFQIIYDNLQGHKFVCITDGDIVFKNKEFMNYCLENIGENDMLIQNDSLDDESHENLCSGFMFIKSSEKTINFFNPASVKKKSDIKEGWGDQMYVNEQKENIAYEMLPLSLFPNGKFFELNHFNIDPYLIHFNWLIGHSKARMIVKHREYYSVGILLSFVKDILVTKYKRKLKRFFS